MRIKSIIKSSVFVLILMYSFSATSQVKMDAASLNAEWKMISESEGVQIYFSRQECKMGNVEAPFIYGFVKIVNTNDVSSFVNYSYKLHYTDGCIGCDQSEEYIKGVSVDSNQSIAGDCSFQHGELVILLKNPLQTEYLELVAVEIIDIKVK